MTKREEILSDCKKHDETRLGQRDRSLRAFRLAAADLWDQLNDLGPNTTSADREQARQDLMNTLQGALDDSGCPQTMIGSF